MDLSSVACQIGVLDHYDGSSLFVLGNCCVLCGVHVATPVAQQKELVNRCQIIVHLTNITGYQGVHYRSLEELVRNTMESAVEISQYPASMISVNIHILRESETLVSSCINAVSLALLDSSVAMNYVPVAIGTSFENVGAEETVIYAGASGNVVSAYTCSVSTLLNQPFQDGILQARRLYQMLQNKMRLKFNRQLSHSSPVVFDCSTLRKSFSAS